MTFFAKQVKPVPTLSLSLHVNLHASMQRAHNQTMRFISHFFPSFIIGGFYFQIFPLDEAVVSVPLPQYQPFIGANESRNMIIDITISIQFKQRFDIDNCVKIFDHHHTWGIYKDHQDYWLTQNGVITPDGCRFTKMANNFTEITCFYLEALTNMKETPVVLPHPLCYPLDRVLMMHLLPQRNGALIHAAGLAVNDKGYLFPGRSGAGKTTLMRQFQAGTSAVLLSDDRIIVRNINHQFKLYGTPWPGDAGISVNDSAPLAGMMFIVHGAANAIRDISHQEALTRLLPATIAPWYDADAVPLVLDFCEKLILTVPAYELRFTPDTNIVDFIEKFAEKG